MKQTRLILAGGFLGAGKTTLIWDVAQRLISQGLRVGLVTNDQAPELVDSQILRKNNLQVAEVAGSCFCCNFDGFVQAIHSLRSDIDADVILAEPVGSCADLSATIVNPLKKYQRTELLISPLTVLADPSRLKSIIYGGDGGLHEDAAYIYRKQLEEADVILITKSDMLSEDELTKLKKDTSQAFPSVKVMTASTLKSIGVSEWFNEVASREGAGSKLLDIDYNRYAHGEAVLGWLNGTLSLQGENVSWDNLLKDIMKALAKECETQKLRVGHVKVIIENGNDYVVGNIANAQNTVAIRGHAGSGGHARLIVNARVETSPERLDQIVRNVIVQCIDGLCQDEILAWRYLQPGRPNPTHRFDQVVK